MTAAIVTAAIVTEAGATGVDGTGHGKAGQERLADGSSLRLDHNVEYPARPAGDGAGTSGHGAVLNSADLVRPNRLRLAFLASDSVQEKSGTPTHPDPVLTRDQLKIIVTDPARTTPPAPRDDSRRRHKGLTAPRPAIIIVNATQPTPTGHADNNHRSHRY